MRITDNISIGFIEDVLLFLQQLCEGHNNGLQVTWYCLNIDSDLTQNYLRYQDRNAKSYDIVTEVVNYFVALDTLLTTLISARHQSESWIRVTVQTMRTLVEVRLRILYSDPILMVCSLHKDVRPLKKRWQEQTLLMLLAISFISRPYAGRSSKILWPWKYWLFGHCDSRSDIL